MKKSEIVRKLTSRKFVVAVITLVAGIVVICGAKSEVVQIIAGAAMAIIPTVVYCVMEGKVDAASVNTVVDATTEAAGKLGASSAVTDTIKNAADVVSTIVDDEGESDDASGT